MKTVLIGGKTKVSLENVIACLEWTNYSWALMKTGREIFVANTLAIIAARFDDSVFVRTH